MAETKNRYDQLIERIFLQHYKPGTRKVIFQRKDMEATAKSLRIELPKNLGDIIYSFRYRTGLPEAIAKKAPVGHEWVIRSAGVSKYRIELSKIANFTPSESLMTIKVPDATPGIIAKYAFDDEQAILAKIRYNRLVDIFTGVACYSLQNHLRTTVRGIGQVECDEIYLGIDKHGVHYVFPIQAKGGRDKLGIVQIEQDFAMCAEKFPDTIGRPLAAQFIGSETIVLFEFGMTDEGVRIAAERHYRLVDPQTISEAELREYRKNTRDQ